MGQPALEQLDMRSQLATARTNAKNDRRPIPRRSGQVLPFRQKRMSKTQHNMLARMSKDRTVRFTNLNTVPQRPEQKETSAIQKQILEFQNKAKLQMERQRIRSEMKSYQPPPVQTDGYEDKEQVEKMQQSHDKEFLKELQTPEFLKASKNKTNHKNNKAQSAMNKKKIDNAKKAAQKSGKAASKVATSAKGASKMGWGMGNALGLFDWLLVVDFEIPAIGNIFVQMYRGATAILNDGEKIIKGIAGFVEPEPLFRFWSPKDIKKSIADSKADPLFGGGGELSNTIDSIFAWLEAGLGWWIVLYTSMLLFLAFSFFIIVILLIIYVTLYPTTLV